MFLKFNDNGVPPFIFDLLLHFQICTDSAEEVDATVKLVKNSWNTSLNIKNRISIFRFSLHRNSKVPHWSVFFDTKTERMLANKQQTISFVLVDNINILK